MKEFQKNPKRSRLIYSPLALIIFAIILGIFFWNVAGLVHKNIETARNKEKAQREYEKLSQEKVELKKEVSGMSDPKYEEEIIRSKLGVVKSGEGVVLIVDSDTSPAAATATAGQSGFWNFFKNLFHKK